MEMKYPKSVSVTIDKREKNPLPFPETILWHPRSHKPGVLLTVKTKKVTLESGDYCLTDWPTSCIIERKGSLAELHQNLLTKDYGRFLRALAKLESATPNPHMVLELPPSCLWLPSEYCPSPSAAFDALVAELLLRPTKLTVWASSSSAQQRRNLGEFVLRLLLGHAWREETPNVANPKESVSGDGASVPGVGPQPHP